MTVFAGKKRASGAAAAGGVMGNVSLTGQAVGIVQVAMLVKEISFFFFSLFNVWLPLVHPLLGTWPKTRACALTGNQTRHFASQALAQSTELHQPGQGDCLKKKKPYSKKGEERGILTEKTLRWR